MSLGHIVNQHDVAFLVQHFCDLQRGSKVAHPNREGQASAASMLWLGVFRAIPNFPRRGVEIKSAGLAGVSSGMGLDDGLLVCTLLLLI